MSLPIRLMKTNGYLSSFNNINGVQSKALQTMIEEEGKQLDSKTNAKEPFVNTLKRLHHTTSINNTTANTNTNTNIISNNKKLKSEKMKQVKQSNDKQKLQAFTLTFGDVAENHKGMEKIGQLAANGFTIEDLNNAQNYFNSLNAATRLVHLNQYLSHDVITDDAYILIIKNGVNILLNDDDGANKLFIEQDNLEKDKKALMYGRVVNKHARHNLCFSSSSSLPDYEKGKGRIIAFDEVPLLNQLRTKFGEVISEAKHLQVEGNYYYDVTKCGIGFHGDTERRKVIGVRLGISIPLVFVWYHNNQAITDVINCDELHLDHGDIYFMNEKATGFDWKRSSLYTLRHAAGSNKFITL